MDASGRVRFLILFLICLCYSIYSFCQSTATAQQFSGTPGPPEVLSGTTIDSPTVEGTWTSQGSPYNISNSISIPTGKTLVIEPGVRVLFLGRYTINVVGNLLARGTKSDSIVFDRFDANSSWHSIRIENVDSGSDSTIFEYCRISYTEYAGGDVTANGGNAVTVKNFNKVRISNCLLRNNNGGRGAGVYVVNASIQIDHNTIRNNYVAQYGAGICVEGGSPIIKGNRIERNNAYDRAGGIYLGGSRSLVEDNVISYNSCYWSGSGVVISNSNAVFNRNLISYNKSEGDDGGGMAIYSSSPKIINNTIAYNIAEDGEGVLIGYDASPDFINTIIYSNQDSYQKGNLGDEIYISSSNAKPNFYNCALQGGTAGIVLYQGTYGGIAKNIVTEQPLFKEPNTNDFSLMWVHFPFIDNTRSPCIDAGSLDSSHDPDGSTADIGWRYFHQSEGLFPPRVDFVGDTLLGVNSLMVSFADLSDRGNAAITGWLWDFGDGTTSTEQNPVHSYTTEGTYHVMLTIQDGNGFVKAITRKKYVRILSGNYLKGTVTGVYNAGRYIVGGDLLVPSGNAMEIKPGASFMFIGPYKLEVRGALKAKGTAQEPILFTFDSAAVHQAPAPFGNSQNGGWRGLYVYASGTQDSTVIDHCRVHLVQNNGLGAIYAFSNNGAAGMRISNSDISYNASQGIHVFATQLIIRNNYIHHNYAGLYEKGGGIYFYSGSPKVVNNIIAYNSSLDDGGGLCIYEGARPTLVNNVIVRNSASRGGGISDFEGFAERINNTIAFNSNGGYFLLYAGDVKFTNCIISNNTSYQMQIADPYSRMGFRNSILQGGSAAIVGYPGSVFLYENMITSDPLLMTDAFALGRLFAGSPAVDAGIIGDISNQLPSFDVVGNPRIENSQIDIGAYEMGADPVLSVKQPLTDLNMEEDFEPFVIPLDPVFSNSYGVGFISFRLGNSTNLINITIMNNALYISPKPDLFGDQLVNVQASNGLNEVGSSFTLHIAPVDDPPRFTTEGNVSLVENFEGTRSYSINVPIPFGEGDQLRVFDLQPSTADFVEVQFNPTGTLSFKSQPDRFGSKWFLLTMTEGLQSRSESFFLSVSPVSSGGLITGIERVTKPVFYPNPVVDHIVVKGEAGSTIALYAVTGQLVHQERMVSTEQSIEVRDLIPGLYLLAIEGDNGRYVFKLVKR